jgi:hypothetical protein
MQRRHTFGDAEAPANPAPNTPFQPMPLRVTKIMAILTARMATMLSRAIGAARLNGKPFGGVPSRPVGLEFQVTFRYEVMAIHAWTRLL